MSGARHDHHLSGDFQFHDELASLFAHQRPDMVQQQPWFMDYYLHATAVAASSPLDCDAFVGDFDDDVPPPPGADEVVKRELVVADTAAASGGGGGGGTTTMAPPLTPNSMSMSSTSSEACGAGAGKCKKEEGDGDGLESKDHGSAAAAAKGDAEGEEKNKKGAANKGKGKGEKRPRQPRFAFMTKSEVDHLEDGYRWRKYGQKAVKNSPFPRSYYRCTTQKCPVKKRVERSYQEAAVVVTTYEGKHTHPIPATLRGSSQLLAAAHHHPMSGLHHHHPHFRMPPPPAALGGFRPGGANAFDALGLGLLQPPSQQQQQQQQGHHHNYHGAAMQQLAVSGAGVQQQVNAAAMASHAALPADDQHGWTASIAGVGAAGSTSAATTAAGTTASAPLRMQHLMAQDYAGLLQDMLPSFVHNEDHHHH